MAPPAPLRSERPRGTVALLDIRGGLQHTGVKASLS
jgi:hypothetical protein